MPRRKAGPAEKTRAKIRISGGVAQQLGVAIVRGELAPGALLEGEIVASERLKISRTAYREAVRILGAKGLVETRPKTGTQVSQPADWHLLDPDVLSWLFDNDPSEDIVQQIFELRGVVEPRLAALAAARRSKGQLDRMADALERMAAFTLMTAEGRQADQEFHAAIIEACGNAFMASLTGGIGAAVTLTTSYKSRASRLLRDAIPDHREVYEAIAAADPFEAHAAMKRLVDQAMDEALADPPVAA